MREFLNDENKGLDLLIDYLSFRLGMMRHEQRIAESRSSSEERLTSNTQSNLGSNTFEKSIDKTFDRYLLFYLFISGDYGAIVGQMGICGCQWMLATVPV